MYKVFDGKTWYEFSTYEYLLNWLSQFNRNVYGRYNSFISCTGTNPGDTYYAGISFPSGEYVGYIPRCNRIINEDGVSIYTKQLVKDVMGWNYSQDIMQRWLREKNAKRKHHYYNGWRGGIPDSAYPDFRGGPWPYIHSRLGCHTYRCIKTTNEKRQTTPSEFEQFTRKSRGKNLPDSWDDPLRDWRDRGWKAQGKNKHQWEHKVKAQTKHNYHKSVYVDNSQVYRETLEEILHRLGL